MKRDMIRIDEEKCNGCGACIPNCPEGAIQIIDGKARLVGEALCDGLGACVGFCPEGAMTVESREAEEYDERRVMANIVKQGMNVVAAHLKHLDDHGQTAYLDEGLAYLEEQGIEVPEYKQPAGAPGGPGCGCQAYEPRRREAAGTTATQTGSLESRLRQWPVQLKLLPVKAPYFQNADLLIAADCVPFAHGGFHGDLLRDRTVIVFCPKLDHGIDEYVEKLSRIFRENDIKSITIAHMEVPCCYGTDRVIEEALEKSGKHIPVETRVISIQGETLENKRW